MSGFADHDDGDSFEYFFLALLISILFLVACLILLLKEGGLRHQGFFIQGNLCTVYMFAQLFTIIGAFENQGGTWCKINGVIIFLFHSSGLAWIAALGLSLVQQARAGPIDDQKTVLPWYALFGFCYGLPLVITAVAAGANTHDFGPSTIHHCWVASNSWIPYFFMAVFASTVLFSASAAISAHVIGRSADWAIAGKASFDRLNTAVVTFEALTAIIGLKWIFGALLMMREETGWTSEGVWRALAYFYIIPSSLIGAALLNTLLWNQQIKDTIAKIRRLHCIRETRPSQSHRARTDLNPRPHLNRTDIFLDLSLCSSLTFLPLFRHAD